MVLLYLMAKDLPGLSLIPSIMKEYRDLRLQRI